MPTEVTLKESNRSSKRIYILTSLQENYKSDCQHYKCLHIILYFRIS